MRRIIFPRPFMPFPDTFFLHPFMFIRLRLSGITHRRVMSSGASHWLSPRRPKLNETGTTAPTHVCITPLPGNVPADGCACRHSRPRARYPKQAACSNRRAFRPLRRMRHKAEVAPGEVCENPDGESVAWLRLPHSAAADASRDTDWKALVGRARFELATNGLKEAPTEKL